MKRKIKQFISLSVALCLVFSLFAFQPTFVNAQDAASEKQMLYVTMGDSDFETFFTTSAKLATGKEYKIYFKYKSLSGNDFIAAASGTKADVVVHADGNRSSYLTTDWVPLNEGNTHNDSAFDKRTFGEEGVSDIEITFTSRTEASQIGFRTKIGAASKFYIADFKVVDTEDGSVVTEGLEGFKKTTGTATGELLTYDDSFFYEDAVTLTSTGSGTYSFSKKANANDEFKIYFKYKVDSGVFGVASEKTVNFTAKSGTTVLYSTGNIDSDTFTVTEGNDGWNDIELSFKAAQAYNTLTFSFDFNKATTITVADFIIYWNRVGDSSYNGWGNYVLANGLGGFTASSVTATANSLSSDEFTTAFEDYMLKIDHTEDKVSGQYGIKLPLTTSNKYKISFKYRIVRDKFENEPILRVSDNQNKSGTWSELISTDNADESKKIAVTSSENGWSDIELTFTAPTAVNNNHFILINFPAGENFTLYITDWSFYKYDTTTETYNLCGTFLGGFKVYKSTNGFTETKLPKVKEFFEDKFDIDLNKYINSADLSSLRTVLLYEIEESHDLNGDENTDICDLVRLYNVTTKF